MATKGRGEGSLSTFGQGPDPNDQFDSPRGRTGGRGGREGYGGREGQGDWRGRGGRGGRGNSGDRGGRGAFGGFGLREIREIGKGVEIGEVEAEAEGMSEDLGRVEIVREMGEKTGIFSRILPEVGRATLAARKVEGGSRTNFGILKMEEVRTFAKVLFCMRRIGFEW